MATFDDLFGKKATGGSRWMKFNEEGESFLLEQTGEPFRTPQKEQNGKLVWLVQQNDGDKYKPMAAGTFDEDEVENAFQPDGNVTIPAKVLAKKLKDGSKDEAHEPFDTDWELTKDQVEKFKEALLDSGKPAEAGTRYAVKLLSRSVKPYKYSVKVIEA